MKQNLNSQNLCILLFMLNYRNKRNILFNKTRYTWTTEVVIRILTKYFDKEKQVIKYWFINGNENSFHKLLVIISLILFFCLQGVSIHRLQIIRRDGVHLDRRFSIGAITLPCRRLELSEGQ